MTTNKFTVVTIAVMAFFAVVGYVVYIQLNPSDTSQVNSVSGTSVTESPESFEVGSQDEIVTSADTTSDSDSAGTAIIEKTYDNTVKDSEWRDVIRVNNSVSYASPSNKSTVTAPKSTVSEGGSLVSPIPEFVDPSYLVEVEGYPHIYEILEKIRLQQEAFTTEALLPEFSTLGVSLSGYKKCGTVPDINNNQSLNEYVNELKSDSALLCLGESFATTCSSVVVNFNAADSYMTQVPNIGCAFIQVFDLSEFDSGLDEIINVCPVEFTESIPDQLSEVGVDITSNVENVFSLVERLLDKENKLKSLKSSTYQNSLEIIKLENEIDSLEVELFDVGELSEDEYYSIATIVSSGYNNCTTYSR